jgi:hypothetical protein
MTIHILCNTHLLWVTGEETGSQSSSIGHLHFVKLKPDEKWSKMESKKGGNIKDMYNIIEKHILLI